MAYYKVPDAREMARFLGSMGLRLDLGDSGYIMFDGSKPENRGRAAVHLGYSFGTVIQFFDVDAGLRKYQDRILEYPGLEEVADINGAPCSELM